jgi:hypothetical protein
MALIRALGENLPEGVHALRFGVDRTGDGTGVTLKVDLLDETRARQLGRLGSLRREPTAPKGVLSAWNFNQRVEVGAKQLYGPSGISTHAPWLEEKHSQLLEALTAACSSSPENPFAVRIQLIPDLGK